MIGWYLVTGNRAYRGHDPGEDFYAVLAVNAEQRAVARGAIRVLDRLEPVLPDNYGLPKGWIQ